MEFFSRRSVSVYIGDSKPKKCTLYKTLNIPAIPPVGMKVYFDDLDDGDSSVVQEVDLFIEPNGEGYYTIKFSHVTETSVDLIESLKKEGWAHGPYEAR